MRKFLLNGAVISALFALIPTLKKSKQSRTRFEMVVPWIVWATTLAAAIGQVRDEAVKAQQEEQFGEPLDPKRSRARRRR